MGLTLNSNSLTLESAGGGGGGSSGLTQAQVDARIATKSPWTFIGKIENDGTNNIAEFDITSDYLTYMIIGDGVGSSTSNFFRARYIAGGTDITTGYGFGMRKQRSTSEQYLNFENNSLIDFSQDNTDHPKNLEFVFTTTGNGKRPVFRFHLGGGTSTYDPFYCIGGGQLNISTSSEITGMKMMTSNGNFDGGSFKLYGLN